MARDLTPYQKGIVNRYNEHKGTIMAQKLGEIASDLFVCADARKAERLWKSAATALANTKADPAVVARVLREKDVKALAALAADVSAGKIGTAGRGG